MCSNVFFCYIQIKVLRGNVDTKQPSPLKTRSQRKRKIENSTEVVSTDIPSSKVWFIYFSVLRGIYFCG